MGHGFIGVMGAVGAGPTFGIRALGSTRGICEEVLCEPVVVESPAQKPSTKKLNSKSYHGEAMLVGRANVGLSISEWPIYEKDDNTIYKMLTTSKNYMLILKKCLWLNRGEDQIKDIFGLEFEES
ncbi:unnamed protein product [Lactuca virosa]|uniref:Uncharacterized protein n=1 Tax=Lactuca virosa TaxID=75947 RepID=A0AAU9LNN5_9ASTR|nr:unnamed protein product [Lactuca virosa]